MLKHRLEIDYQLNDIDAVSPCTNLMLCNQKLTTLQFNVQFNAASNIVTNVNQSSIFLCHKKQ